MPVDGSSILCSWKSVTTDKNFTITPKYPQFIVFLQSRGAGKALVNEGSRRWREEGGGEMNDGWIYLQSFPIAAVSSFYIFTSSHDHFGINMKSW